MITRIVRMSFQPEQVDKFRAIFDKSSSDIRSFDGCEFLALHRDHHQPNVYYTISKWQSQQHLDRYRTSKLFLTTWAATKKLFNDKPKAHSLEEVISIS